MNKAEYILGHIKNWDRAIADVYTDSDRAFSMMYRMKLEESEMLNAWKYLAQKAPFIAYSLIKKYKDNGYVKDGDILTEVIWQATYQTEFFNTRCLADVLSVAALLEKDITENIADCLTQREDKDKICILACKNIESISGREKNLLELIKLISKYIENEFIERTLVSNKYQFSKYGVESQVLSFISQLLQEGSFVLAYLVKKIYDVNFTDAKIMVDELYISLSKCDKHNFFRGGIIYKEFIVGDNEIQILRKWYIDMTRIRTEVAREEMSGIKMLYLCQALQINPYAPEDILREIQISIKNSIFQKPLIYQGFSPVQCSFFM